MEGASDRTESGPLTGLWGKAVLAAGGVSVANPRQRVRRQAWSSSRHEVSEVDAHSSPAEDNAAERGAPLRGLADIGAHQDSGAPATAGSAEA